MKLNGDRILLVLLLSTLAAACGGDNSAAPRGGRGGPGGAHSVSAVPVEVVTATRRTISSFIETNGTLEAEVEVDLVSRISAPIIALAVEEGDRVAAGQLLARLDDVEIRVQAELARVAVAETQQAYDRAKKLHGEGLISPEEYERAVAAYDSARVQSKASQIQLQFTELHAPFAGHIVRRYVDPAEQVSVNTPIYRLSDFDPLLCPIQIPERDLPRVRVNQAAWLSVEAAPGERFPATVLRISPIVEAATGTIKVTLQVRHAGRLRPGMFARVFVETESRENALVIPRAALSLESIGDTVYVAADGSAARREVELGFREGDMVEIRAGIEDGEQIVVVGQDGLSDGTPLQILAGATEAVTAAPEKPAAKGRRGGRPDFAHMTDEQLEQIKTRMRSTGLTDEQIEERIKRRRAAAASGE